MFGRYFFHLIIYVMLDGMGKCLHLLCLVIASDRNQVQGLYLPKR
jgi:hypothetical protein